MSVAGRSIGHGPSTRHVRLKRVLVVDKDPFWGQALRSALEQSGYYLNLVVEPAEGRRRAFERTYDLVVLSDSLGEGVIQAIVDEIGQRRSAPPVLIVARVDCLRRRPETAGVPIFSILRRPCAIENVVDAARALAGSPWEEPPRGAS
jgi:DNA-binding response OmpR family regulator